MAVKAGYWLKDEFPVESIDPTYFTHVFYAFANLKDNQVFIPSEEENQVSQFTDVLKTKKPSIKTILSIGGDGGDELKDAFAAMAANPRSRKTFILSSINVAKAYSFDGLDLDYEHPRTQSEMANLGILFTEWRTEINAKNPHLLLTAAIRYKSVGYDQVPYPAQAIKNNLNWINVMAYDFRAPNWADPPNTTGATAVLRDPITHVSGSDGVDSWIAAGVPPAKIVLGIPFFGYAWRLANPSNNGYGAPTRGSPPINPSNGGYVKYSEIVNFLNANRNAHTVYNRQMVGVYSYVNTTWISYDNEEAVAAKVKYVHEKGLLGYFVWEIGSDYNFALAAAAARAAV